MNTQPYETGRILIADDQPWNLEPLEALLTVQGYIVIKAANGREALERTASFQPDLFLLDVMMPEMDGFETCAALKNDPACRDIPVIFMSADDDIASITCGFELGAIDYISKPFQKAELLARVRAHLQSHHARARHRQELMDSARQLEAVATVWMDIAHSIASEAETLLSQEIGDGESTLPVLATQLAQHARMLAGQIEHYVAREDGALRRESSLHALQHETTSSDVQAFLGAWYLRGKRQGLSLTMPRHPQSFIVDAPPENVKRLIDSLVSRYVLLLPHGSQCHVGMRCTPHSNVCVHLATTLPDTASLHEGYDREMLIIPPECTTLLQQIGASYEASLQGENIMQLTIHLPGKIAA